MDMNLQALQETQAPGPEPSPESFSCGSSQPCAARRVWKWFNDCCGECRAPRRAAQAGWMLEIARPVGAQDFLNLFFLKKKKKIKKKIFFIFEKTSFCLFDRGISFAAREKLWREALQMFDYMQSPKLRERSWSASLREITLRNMWIQKHIHL